MVYHVEPQPYSSRQELQKIEAGPSGNYKFANLQTSPTQSHLGHQLIEFPKYFPAEYAPQNPAPNDDENDWLEARFGIPQDRFSWTPLFQLEADWNFHHEVDVQPPHEKQMWGLAELGSYTQGVPDTISYSDESDTTSSGQSSLSILGDYYSMVAISLPQTSHEASYDSKNFGLYQSTPGSFSDTNRGIQKFNRYHTENSSSSAPGDTPLTQLLTGSDSDFTPDYPTTHSNNQPLHDHRRTQRGNQQDIKPSRRRCSSTCARCGAHFKRPGNLLRHLSTATAHGLAKGPICPLGGCKYGDKRFTRVDNLKAHFCKDSQSQ